MTKDFFLSVCAVVFDEAPYIEEFIEFHRLQGVEHFYFYDNGSTDGTLEILSYYQAKGLVTIHSWKHVRPIQFKAYDDCLNRYREESEWIAFIDCDEFLHSMKPDEFNVADWLFRVERDVSAVAVSWVFFGSNYHERRTEGLVLERFIRRQSGVDKHVKSIVRSLLTSRVGANPHTFRPKGDRRIINELGLSLPLEYAHLPGGSAKTLRISHFHCKSRSEYMERKRKEDPGTRVVDNDARVRERFEAHDLNECLDTMLRDKFAEEIKKQIRGIDETDCVVADVHRA